jgi:uncharacterized damage-inducible protein DinB
MSTLPILYRHHRWSWLTLFDTLATLPEDVLALTSPGTYGSIHETITHTMLNERRFIDAINASRPVSLERLPDPLPSLADLHAHFVADAEDLIEAAGRVTAETMVTGEFRGQKFQLPAVIPLFQAYNHGVEHRTDITTILSAHGYELPAVHLWAFNEKGMP